MLEMKLTGQHLEKIVISFQKSSEIFVDY